MIEGNSLLLAGLVLGLLCAVLVLAPKMMRAAGFDPMSRPGRRLSVIEAAALDPRRRLVLARCDGREVLLLIGGASDTVVGWLPGTIRPNQLPAGQPTTTDELA